MATRQSRQLDEVSLEEGHTLPADWYTDEQMFRLERELVFSRFWGYLGFEGSLSEPGSYFTTTLGQMPVVVSRATDGEIHAFANVCQHRGAIVASGSGTAKLLQCPYHAWTYRMDGTLNRAPSMEGIVDFDKADYSLPPLRVDRWGPFIFGSLNHGIEPLSEYLGGFPELVGGFGLDFSRLKWRDRREYEMHANWKVVVENFLECYHCPVLHPGFTAVQDTGRYKFYGIGKYFTSQGGPVRPSAQVDSGDGERTSYTSDLPEGCYSYIWPNFTFNLFPGATGATTMLWLPIDVDETLAIFDFFYSDDVSDEEARATTEFVDQVQREDLDICASVQQGLSSGAYIRGRLNTNREDESTCEIALTHFEKLVYQTMRSAR